MGRNPARRDFVGRTLRTERALRQVRITPRSHTEVKTFIVGGFLEVGDPFIPPAYIGVNYDEESPEWKLLIGFAAIVNTGTVTLSWKHNADTVKTGHVVTTTSGYSDLTIPRMIANGDLVQPVITAADSANNLAAAFFMATQPG